MEKWNKRKGVGFLVSQESLNGKKIAIIGAGSMGGLLVEGLIKIGVQPCNLFVTRRNKQALGRFRRAGANVSMDNSQAASNADIVILCTKPGNVAEVANEIKNDCTGKLVISIAACVPTANLQRILHNCSIGRAMPNIGAQIGISRTELCFAKGAKASHKRMAEILFFSLGECMSVKEKLMDLYTVLGSCTPALAAFMVDSIAKAAKDFGLGRAEAQKAVAAGFLAAAELIGKRGKTPGWVIKKVASPEGLTAKGILRAKELKINKLIEQVVKAMLERSLEIGKQLQGVKK